MLSTHGGDRLTSLEIWLDGLDDPDGEELVVRAYRNDVDHLELMAQTPEAGLSAPVSVPIPPH